MVDELTGQVFAGKYKIESKLGEGSMGAVYQARHTYLHRKVAIKFLRVELLEGDQGFKRFLREAQVLSRLSHPNAIHLHDFGVEDGTPYLIMEFVQGHTLKQLLAEETFLPVADCAQILTSVCGALAEAHSKGIIHRDLKPENIMLAEPKLPTDSRVVKVLDFGISKVLVPEDIDLTQTDMTQKNMLLGTPRYIPPEQALGRLVDARADLYSLGAITYEMLNGSPPFRGMTAMNVIAQHLQQLPEPFDSARKIKPAVCKVVLKALAKDPDGRQDGVDQFLDEFVAAAGLRGATGTESAPAAKRKEPKAEGHRFLAFAVVALVVGLSLAWMFNSGVWRDEPAPGAAAIETRITEPGAMPAGSTDGNLAETDGAPIRQNSLPGGSSTPAQQRPDPHPANRDSEQAPAPPSGIDSAGDVGSSQSPPPELEPIEPLPLTKPAPGLYIELNRLPTLEQALRLQDSLKSEGFPTSIQLIAVEGEPFHEVLVGPFNSIPEAKTAGARLKRLAVVDGPVNRMRTIF